MLWWMNFHPPIIIFICFYPLFPLRSRPPLLFNLFMPFPCQSSSLYLDVTLSSKSVFADLWTLCHSFTTSLLVLLISEFLFVWCLQPCVGPNDGHWVQAFCFDLFAGSWFLISLPQSSISPRAHRPGSRETLGRGCISCLEKPAQEADCAV